MTKLMGTTNKTAEVMALDQLTTFFGWMAILNIAYLALASLVIMAAPGWLTGLHQRWFGMAPHDLKMFYFKWLAQYKIATLIFAVAPYLALRLI